MFFRHGWYSSEAPADRHVFALYVKDQYLGLYNNQMPPGDTFNNKKYLWPDLPSVNNFLNIDLKNGTSVQSLFSKTNNSWSLAENIYKSTGYFIHYSIYELNEEEKKDTKERFSAPYQYQFIAIENVSDNRELEIF